MSNLAKKMNLCFLFLYLNFVHIYKYFDNSLMANNIILH